MSDAVAQSVDFVKFVEDVRVVVLHLRRGAVFVWEDTEKRAASETVLHGREHVFPDAELKAGEELGVGIDVVSEQLVISMVYYVAGLVEDGIGENAAGHDGVFEPLGTHTGRELLVNGVAQRHFETADDGERLLRKL